MTLQLIEVRSPSGDLLSLPLLDIESGYLVEDVLGLDPVKATVVSSSFATIDGSEFQSVSRENRNVLLKVALEPDPATDTVRGLRANLYKFLMPKSQVSLRFITVDELEVDVVGRVESFEAPLFTKEPSVSVSIICFDPDLIDVAPVTLEGETVSDATETLVEYAGSVNSGLQLVVNVDRDLTEFTIYHRAPDGTIRTLDVSAELENGDVVTISTVRGDKYANLLRASTTSSLLYGVSPQASWVEFEPGGDNFIRVYAEGDEIPYTLTYLNRYGGL